MMTGRSTGEVGVLMVAIGGYGYHYLQALLDQIPPGRARLAGVVDPEAARSPARPRVAAAGVPVRDRVEDYFADGFRADLAVIVSPIQHHVSQSLVALEHGCDVLCDKPLGAAIQDALLLVSRRDAAGRRVEIGYQWSFSGAVQALKRDILAGLYGCPVRFSTLCCWPRDRAYYRRNDWAGRLRDPAGRLVLDGPANNAMAHYLHNLLFLAGREQHLSARPREVQAELYRAYPIESYDTAVCRATTEDGPEILFFATHAAERAIEPCFELEFDAGRITLDATRRTIAGEDRQGRRKEYGSPDDTWQFRKLEVAIDAARQRDPRYSPDDIRHSDTPVPNTVYGPRSAARIRPVCGPEAAAAQTLVVNGMHESVKDVQAFPRGLVAEGAASLFVRGLATTLATCYRARVLPSEAGVDWAVPGNRVTLSGYDRFPAHATGHGHP